MGLTPIVSTSDVGWGPWRARFLLWALLVGGAASWFVRPAAGLAALQPALQGRPPTATAVGEPGLAPVSAGRTAEPRMALPPGTVEPPAREARVLVQGHAYYCGFALAGWELTFHPSGLDPHLETDWDITDDDGHFEVLLPVASYTVRSTDGGTWAADLLVPPGEHGLTVDFDLPPAAVDAPDW